MILSQQIIIAVYPPSTRIIAPVTNDEILYDENRITAPTSSPGSPTGPWVCEENGFDTLHRQNPSVLFGREKTRSYGVHTNPVGSEFTCRKPGMAVFPIMFVHAAFEFPEKDFFSTGTAFPLPWVHTGCLHSRGLSTHRD